MITLTGLNPQQRQAAETIEGPVLILAGAGSGKTRTITYRIAHMVYNLGISAKQILGVSFTNKAAKEMRERVTGLLGKTRMRGISLTTFHSLGVKILKEDIDKLGYHKNFSIYDTTDQFAIIRSELKRFKAEKSFDVKEIQSRISYLKNQGVGPEDYQHSSYFDEDDTYCIAVEQIYREYEDKLKFYNAIDFDDILFLVVLLFRDHPDVADKWSEKFKYIMIDEYQDTNHLQFELVMGLTRKHNNLCVVGDDDQSIYAFRGADITNILNFEKSFPGAKVVKLEENYRSTSPILELANDVIQKNKDRRDKTLWSRKASPEKPLLWLTQDTDHEAEIVVEQIVNHQSLGKHLGDIAILYRSNTQAQPLEEQLRLSQVPYTIIGGQKFYEKKEVKDLISYMTVLLNPKDQMAIRRILNVPNRGIGRVTLEKYLKVGEERGMTLFEAMTEHPEIAGKSEKNIRAFSELIKKQQEHFDNHPLNEAISMLIDDIEFFKFIEKQYDSAKQVERRKNDVMVFIESAERFVQFQKNHATLKNFVEKLLLQDNQDKQEDDEDDDVRKNEVTLMTLHSSKGLEFDTVYLVGMEEESLPHKNVIKLGEDISEERRLCYVGITRAQQKLIMTYCKERKIYGKNLVRHKSRFLEEIDKEELFVHQDRTNFGHLASEEEIEQYKKDKFAAMMNLLDD